MTSVLNSPIAIYATLGVIGLFIGPFVLRFALGLAPGGLKTRAAKWQLHRALNMGDGWLVHQTGDRQYELFPIEADAETLEIGDERVELDNLGHLSTKTGSVPMGVSFGPGAVEDSPLVGVSGDAHIQHPPGSVSEWGPDDDDAEAEGERGWWLDDDDVETGGGNDA
jgi:hypothetical protein